ncbi:unnamed protein product [Rhizophagus irregularis]|nr:unnamed protein product [Rhizophagus irregularis]
MTPSRKEYLFKLADLSENSHTGNFLSEIIGEVIEKIGANKISAIVSDNASNVRSARQVIQNKYPNIENVRCIAHAINLIACDIVKNSFGDRLLKKVNILASFFKSSHQAGAKLTQLIKKHEINGGGIKLFCKTRWTTASESTDSIIRLEPVLEEIVTDENNLLNDKVKRIIQTRNFFSDLRILSFVLSPLRKAVLSLESRSATLGDCFLGLIRLSAVLKKLPKTFNQSFRNHCFNVANERLKEFDDDKYLTCFFLDPRFRYQTLKNNAYSKIMRCATTIGKNLGFDLEESRALCEQIRNYKDFKPPFDLDIACSLDEPINWWNLIITEPQPDSLPRLARHLLAICPNSASCERGFSTLGWLFHNRRLNLDLTRLESMSKMIMYWKSNAKSELGFYGIDQKKNTRISETELNIRIAEAFAEADDDDDHDENENLLTETSVRQTINGETIPPDNCIVLIEDIWLDKVVDLSHELIIKEIGEIPNDVLEDDIDESGDEGIDVDDSDDGDESQREEKGVLDYDIDNLLDEFISEEEND